MPQILRYRLQVKFGALRDRCEKPVIRNYKNYGGRGIKVHWNNSEEFISDMGAAFASHIIGFGRENTTLERIDNDGDYCKDNCCWATYQEQASNQRRKSITKNKSGFRGVSLEPSNKKKWKAQITFNKQVIYLGVYEKAEDAGEAYKEADRRLRGKNSLYLN